MNLHVTVPPTWQKDHFNKWINKINRQVKKSRL